MTDRASDDAERGMAADREIDRLRREVRALRHEIARPDPVAVRSVSRTTIVTTGLGAVAIGGAIVTASLTIAPPTLADWGMMARIVPAQAAVGIVERIFTVY